jgi:hypothetical protein
MNSVHTSQHIYFNTPFNTAHSYMLRSSLSFPHENPVCISLLPHECQRSRLPHPSCFYDPHMWQGVQTMTILITKFYSSSCCFLLGTDYLPQYQFLVHLQPKFFLSWERLSSTSTYNGKITVPYILILMVL